MRRRGTWLNRCGSGGAPDVGGGTAVSGVGNGGDADFVGGTAGAGAHATETTGAVDYLLALVVNLILYSALFPAESLTVSTIT